MDFNCEHIIEDLYNSDLVTNVTTSSEYKKLLSEYNKLFNSIEDKEVQNKIEKLERLKNDLSSENDKMIFKLGYSIATKMLIEALSFDLK